MSAEWKPAPGERVAVLASHDYGRSRSVAYAVVDRVGKRDVVLDDGRRFRVSDLTLPVSGTWNSTATKLVKDDDPIVAVVNDEQTLRHYMTRARTVCEDFRYQRDGVTAADAILALAPLTGVRAQIEALFAGVSA